MRTDADAATPMRVCRSFVAEMFRPVGSSRWGMASCLAAALGAVLAATAATGHPELGSAVALGVVLTAVPSLPVSWREALQTLAIRAAAIVVGAVCAIATVGRPVAAGLAVVMCATGGALLARVGPTAGLAVVLIAADGPQSVAADALLPYLAGAAVVAVAWAAWLLCAEVARTVRGRDRKCGAGAMGVTWQERLPHALRVALAVAIAVSLAGLLPDELVGGHWLVTSVLLTVQPAAADTGMRLAQRLSGNTVGALIAAVVLGSHPSLSVVAVVAVVLFTLAMALRPVNYTWWAVTGPPVLLMVSEYPRMFPWYEGGVRLAMNVAGAVIVIAVVFGLPALRRNGSRSPDENFTVPGSSDTVYENRSRRMR
ncbi:FUSC family protein [Mycolicibacterium sp. 3033]|nr:FUSC family protein [Mycolicibacterium aurantiacum]